MLHKSIFFAILLLTPVVALALSKDRLSHETKYKLEMLGYTTEEIRDLSLGKTTIEELKRKEKLSLLGYEEKATQEKPERKPTITKTRKTKLSERRDNLRQTIERVSSSLGLDKAWIYAIIHQESSFSEYEVSKKGASGLMQLMPKTASMLGVNNLFNPEENILGGSKYFMELMSQFGNDPDLALSAYNAGPEIVKRNWRIPRIKETADYVKKVKKYYNYYAQNE